MEILPNQISLNLEIESTSSPEASLVSRIAQRAKEKGKTMPVTFGPKCFELFEKSDRATSWGRMFMASFLGTVAPYSTRCALTWKLKVTPYGRLLFQLQPSTRRTEETAFGLLPTLRTADIEGGCVDNVQIENGSYFRTNANGVIWGVKLRDVVESGLLPTPQASDFVSTVQEKNHSLRHIEHETGWTQKMLPTPKTQDSRHALRDRGKSNLGEEMSQWGQDNGKGSRLNPRFVAEMMGFPPNWTELPFQNGEKSQ